MNPEIICEFCNSDVSLNDSFCSNCGSLFDQKVEKVAKPDLNYRKADFPTGKCGVCKYFIKTGACKVVEGDIKAEDVCNAIQRPNNKPTYKLPKGKEGAFGRGMVKEQPYQHIVDQMLNTPMGYLVIIKDTMKPKPHYFSLPIKFHIAHTSAEHHWTQKEVDNLIKIGEKL